MTEQQLTLPSSALFGIAIQQKDDEATEWEKMTLGYDRPETVDGNFRYFPLTGMNIGTQKSSENLPDEIGNLAFPSGAYATGVWAEGGASLIARLDDTLGWLLLAITGEVSTITDQKAEDLLLVGGAGTTTTGINSHIFKVGSSDQFFVPWLTIRRLNPHPIAAERLGEIYQDGRARTGTLNIAAGQPVSLDLDLLARVLQDSESLIAGADWSASYGDLDNFAVATCDGHLMINDVQYRVRNIAATFTDNVLPAAQSLHVGSISPIDFPVLSRSLSVTFTALVDYWDFYASVLKGSDVDVSVGTDATIDCEVYTADCDVMVASQTAIGAAGDATEPYRLRLWSNQLVNNVAWSIRPVNIAPNRPVEVQATGTFQAVSGADPFYLVLQNAKANYDLPT